MHDYWIYFHKKVNLYLSFKSLPFLKKCYLADKIKHQNDVQRGSFEVVY